MAIPEAVNTQKGVSVEYAPDPDKRWYVLRASYGREILAEQLLIQSHVYAYVPKRYTYIEVKGRPKKVLQCLIANIVFAYLTPRQAMMFVRNNDPDEPSPAPQLSEFSASTTIILFRVKTGATRRLLSLSTRCSTLSVPPALTTRIY